MTSCHAHTIKLYLLSNHSNVVEHNQALGIAAALEKLSPQKIYLVDLNAQTFTSAEIKAKIEENLSNEKVIVIGTGEGEIADIQPLSKHRNLIICLSSHVFLDDYKTPELLNKVNYIAIPSHEVTTNQKLLGAKLIETTGVTHNRNPEIVDKVYNAWKKELPNCPSYLGIGLGGDVPTLSKEIKFFTQEEAIELAEYIAGAAQNACILVFNGAHTGKYTATKQEDKKVHQLGYSDPITLLFKKQLAAAGIKNIRVFNFQHNTPENKPWISPYDSFDLIVGAVRATDGQIFVPGESTSMISEVIDILPLGHVIVYENNVMNRVHKAYVDSEFAAGRIYLKNYHSIITPVANIKEKKPSTNQIIANKIWEAIVS